MRSRNIFDRMLYVGRSAIRSSRYNEARTRERFGPAGARTAQVTAADLWRSFSYCIPRQVTRRALQHVTTLFFINLTNVAEFMLPSSSFQELSAVVADTSLTKFKLKNYLPISCRMDEQSSAIVICFSLDGILIFKEQSDN